jgi:hypothetical protein
MSAAASSKATHRTGGAGTTTASSQGQGAPLLVASSRGVKIHVDAECQASTREINQSSRGNKKISTTNIILLCIALYIFGCGMFTSSPYLQSQLVYMHSVRWPLGDLTDLTRFGLAEGRSVTIKMNGVDTLEGYHLLPVGPAVATGAALEGLDRDDYFDAQLRNASRIVVYLHGNAATRAHHRRVDMIKQIAAFCNAHVLSFDYR